MEFIKSFIGGRNNSITISGNNIIINGQTLETSVNLNKPDLVIRFEADQLFDLTVNTDKALSIKGDVKGNASIKGNLVCNEVGGNVTASGNISCDDVEGSASAQGNISCDDVGAEVKAGGNVSCDDVNGNVTAGGNVSCDDVAGKVM